MSNKTIRTHTERLEKVIEQGVELRDEMRSKIANLEKIVSAQKAEIINATRAQLQAHTSSRAREAAEAGRQAYQAKSEDY